ncbi:MAG: hypothetical protein IPQ07_38140 [Myxococcales bacterium]|nr:hypothetical protein [Myxococcales bacterium]
MSKLLSIACVVGLGLVACSKSKSDGASGDPCAPAINKAIDAMMTGRQGPPEMMEQMKTISEKLRGILISSCQADKWPADVLGCFQTATDQPAIKKCREKLPPEQAQRVQAEIIKVMSGGMGGMKPPHGGGEPPPPPAGSAAPQ